MFHLEYPQFRGFFTWDELGCLARGLGFPVELFKDNLADEIEQEEHGLCIKEVYKMLDNRLLERAVHRTQNLHTAEWNMNAIHKAVSLLDHRAISFEELYNTRVAYQAYEGFDMMGLHIEKQTLLNTLKMCGRSIAPMKLVNRVKHMSNQLEEKGRIQLYEFLDLVMWCGSYENFSSEDIVSPAGKERDLFKLVDFEKLLSHHDERLAEKLNKEYLREEWDFGRENLGSRHMFKEPPVRCAEDRINMTRRQKRLYRHLKAEVNQSQRGVYRAKAGFIRERPLTAPDLSMYTSKDVPQQPTNFSAQTAYQIILDKVKSARPGDGPVTDTSDRPLYVEAEPVDKPIGITDDDLKDTRKKFEVLQFDMETIDGRFQIMMDDTMNTYYPGHKQRQQEASKPRPKSEILQLRKHEEITLKERPKSESHLLYLQRMEQASTKSSYPESSVSRTQAKLCDSRESTPSGNLKPDRFHGWQTKQGRHYPLVKQSVPNSYEGRLNEKMSKSKTANLSKTKIKDDFLHQQTEEDQMTGESDTKVQESRPSTAPVQMNLDSNNNVTVKKVSLGEKELSPAESCKTDLSAADSCRTVDTGYSSFDDRSSTFSPKEDFSVLKSKTDSLHTSVSGYSERAESDCDKYSTPHSHSRKTSGSSRNNSDWKKSGVEIVPHMDHSKPRPVSVGGMGTISLLENISEARYWEDAYNEEISDEASGDESDTQTQSSTDSGIGRRQSDELQSSLALLKQRLNEQPVPSKAKRAKSKQNKTHKSNEQFGNVLEKEMRIKRQRRSQRPSSRTNHNLVNNSSSVSPVRNDSSTTNQRSNVKSGTRQAFSTPNKSLIHQAVSKSSSDRSTSKQLSPSLHLKGQSTTGERKQTVINYSNNVTSNKTSKIDDSIVKELKKNPQIGRIMKRGEGLLSQDLMKKLIAAHA